MSIVEQIKNQYDSLYASNPEGFMYEEKEPLEAVTKITDYIDKGSVLDIGGGEGRNALYLSEQGFAVTVVDISEVGIKKLQRHAESKGFSIQTQVTDVLEEGINGQYDVVVNTFVLHHMNTEEAEKLIAETKAHTAPGGINVLVTFMNEGGLYERNKNSGRFYPSEVALANLYAGWEIKEVNVSEVQTLARDKNSKRMSNGVVSLVAKNNN